MYFTGKQKLLIGGAILLAVLFVVGSYFGSHWYYGDIEPIEIPEVSVPTPPLPKNLSSSEVDLTGLQGESLPAQTESTPTPITGAEGESVDDFLAGLSAEEIALLTTEVVEEPQRVSPFGFGPYPQVPVDYPEEVIWADMDENISRFGGGLTKAAELMDRVLIKLWNQGHRATSASMTSDSIVYPAFPNTVFVRWDYVEEPDGTTSRYASIIYGAPGVSDSDHDDLGEGIIPPGIKVLDYDSDGIDPYIFLNLNQ